MAGSLDDNPPVIVGPSDYQFAVIIRNGGDYACYRSSKSGITYQEMADRLRSIAEQIEVATDGRV